ncbi:MAG: hypothetical protein U0R72_19390 [Nakamurella multipartita]
MSLIWDMQARREAGVRRPVRAGLRRDLLPSIWSLAVVPVLVYVGSWWAWFASETSWPRHTLVAEPSNRSDWKSGFLYDVAFGSCRTLLGAVDLEDALRLPRPPAHPRPTPARHPWESKPWTWPSLGTRPVLYYSPPTPPARPTRPPNACAGSS